MQTAAKQWPASYIVPICPVFCLYLSIKALLAQNIQFNIFRKCSVKLWTCQPGAGKLHVTVNFVQKLFISCTDLCSHSPYCALSRACKHKYHIKLHSCSSGGVFWLHHCPLCEDDISSCFHPAKTALHNLRPKRRWFADSGYLVAL